MFTRFASLPAETQSQIWRMAASNNYEGRVIECKWHGAAYYQKTTRRVNTTRHHERAGLRWTYRLQSGTRPLGTLSACRESRTITLQENPSYLQLNRGPKIHFNSERDMIYFDLLDTYYMFKYCDHMMDTVGRLNNIRGFRDVQKLARPRIFNYRGFQDLMTSKRHGLLMPNVRKVESLYRPLWVTVHEQVDELLRDICAAIRSKLHIESQRMRLDEDESMLLMQTKYVFQALV